LALSILTLRVLALRPLVVAAGILALVVALLLVIVSHLWSRLVIGLLLALRTLEALLIVAGLALLLVARITSVRGLGNLRRLSVGWGILPSVVIFWCHDSTVWTLLRMARDNERKPVKRNEVDTTV
jgi:hypothetical protein